MLYVDPRTCIDCGACADACPVDAIFPVDSPHRRADGLRGRSTPRTSPDRAGSGRPRGHRNFHAWGQPPFDRVLPADFAPLEVAVVGTGPGRDVRGAGPPPAHHAPASRLIDRLPVAGRPRAVRGGARPPGDQADRRVLRPLPRPPPAAAASRHGHRAATSASTSWPVATTPSSTRSARRRSRPRRAGRGPAGNLPRRPWSAGTTATPSRRRAVAVDPAAPSGSPWSAPATSRSTSPGCSSPTRRGSPTPRSRRPPSAGCGRARSARSCCSGAAARSTPRTPAGAARARHRDDLELVVDDHDPRVGEAIDAAATGGQAALLQGLRRDRRRTGRRRAGAGASSSASTPPPGRVLGDGHVRGRPGQRTRRATELRAGLVVRAVGYRGRPLPGLPFDEDTGTVPHHAGRVDGRPGTYVVGWIKRGPAGGIGANRRAPPRRSRR